MSRGPLHPTPGLQQILSSWQGVSPSTSLKRDRLAQRNAILRRTGFIEGLGGRKSGFLGAQHPKPCSTPLDPIWLTAGRR